MVFCPYCGDNKVKRSGFCSDGCELNWLWSQRKLSSSQRRRLETLTGRSNSFELMMEKRRAQELPFRPDNPVPFKQPFLFMRFKNRKINDGSDGWYVDVDGQIEKYLEGFGFKERTLEWSVPFNSMHRATPLLKSILEYFASRGMEVESVATYAGSAGPSHILRNGIFFERMTFKKVHRILAE